MKSLNQVTVTGNLSKTPEVQESEFGKVAYFDIACNNSFKNDKNEKIEHVVWVSIKAKGSTADFVSKYFKKGDRVTVCGELRNNKQTIGDKTYTFTSVLAKEIFIS